MLHATLRLLRAGGLLVLVAALGLPASAQRRSTTLTAGPAGGARPDTTNVDVVLDVPNLSVEQIVLDVEEVSARLSLRARVANLVQLDAGADVQIGQVHLEITGVQAEAYLRIDLDNVAYIIDRTLQTLENNPEIIETLGATLQETVGTVGDVANTALAPDGALGRTLDNLSRPDGLLTQTVNTLGQTVNRTVDATGQIVETTLNESGGILSRNVVGQVSDLTDVVSETAAANGGTLRRVRDDLGNVIEYTVDQAGQITGARVAQPGRRTRGGSQGGR